MSEASLPLDIALRTGAEAAAWLPRVVGFRARVLGASALPGFAEQASFSSTVQRLASTAGFTLVCALSSSESVLGYAFATRAPLDAENLWLHDVYAAAPALAGTLLIHEVLVGAAYRRSGVGASLIDALRARHPDENLWLACPLAARGALGFYDALGGKGVFEGALSHQPPARLVVLPAKAVSAD